MDRDTAIVQTAIQRGLFTPEEGSAALSEARSGNRPVSEVLVSRGLLAPRTLAALEAPTLPPQAQKPRPLGGDFELTQKLGEGGMGAVYRARQLSLQRDVAVKVLAPNYAANPDAAARFMREAQSAARVSHPNVITVFHVGQDQGRLFMVMELVTGGDADKLAQSNGGRLPERRALEVIRDATQGLVAIERAGLVHRDIKPSNIFITDDGTAKLADLGLARSQTGEDKMTQSGMIVGTPAFMAPEQANALPVDVRTDIYALGASLFQLLTGRAPFIGGTSLAVMTRVLNDPAPDPITLVPGLTAATRLLVMRAMAKQPDERFATAQAFLDTINAALAPRTAAPVAARAPAAASASGRVARAGAGALALAPTLTPTRPATTRAAPAPKPVDGEDADHDEDEGDDGDEAPEKGGPKPAVIAGAVGGLVLVLLIFGVMLRRGKNDTPPDTVAKTTEVKTTEVKATEVKPPPRVTETPPRVTEIPTVTETPVTETPTVTERLPLIEPPIEPLPPVETPRVTEAPPPRPDPVEPPSAQDPPPDRDPPPRPERFRPDPQAVAELVRFLVVPPRPAAQPSSVEGDGSYSRGVYKLEPKTGRNPGPARGAFQASAVTSTPAVFVWRVEGFTRQEPERPREPDRPRDPPNGPPPRNGPRQPPRQQPPRDDRMPEDNQQQPQSRAKAEFALRTGRHEVLRAEQLGDEDGLVLRLEFNEERSITATLAQFNREKRKNQPGGPGLEIIAQRGLDGLIPSQQFLVVMRADSQSWTVAVLQRAQILMIEDRDWEQSRPAPVRDLEPLRTWASFELSPFMGVTATSFARPQ